MRGILRLAPMLYVGTSPHTPEVVNVQFVANQTNNKEKEKKGRKTPTQYLTPLGNVNNTSH